jgi:predicted ester cyclase
MRLRLLGKTSTHSTRLIGVGPLGTIPPTGKRVEVKAVQVVKVRGDKIAETRHYFDLMGLLQQVGAVPTPAGAS